MELDKSLMIKKKINFLDAIINNLIKTFSINTILVVDWKSDKLKFVFEESISSNYF